MAAEKENRFILKINREQCQHAPERRSFDIYNRRTSVFIDVVNAFGTSSCQLEVSLGPLDSGPWTLVNSALFDTNIADLMDEVLKFIILYMYSIPKEDQWRHSVTVPMAAKRVQSNKPHLVING